VTSYRGNCRVLVGKILISSQSSSLRVLLVSKDFLMAPAAFFSCVVTPLLGPFPQSHFFSSLLDSLFPAQMHLHCKSKISATFESETTRCQVRLACQISAFGSPFERLLRRHFRLLSFRFGHATRAIGPERRGQTGQSTKPL
jgi:hypothetical protein